MSSGNLYPPQAFTREMLSQAFVWLQTQPESVREMARNPESLIALYLKTQRSQMHNQKKMESQSSNPYLDAPVSAQNFMTDLKSLAEGLKQFEDPQHAQPTMHGSPAQPMPTAQTHSNNAFAAQLRNEIPAPTMGQVRPQNSQMQQAQHFQSPNQQQHPPSSNQQTHVHSASSPQLSPNTQYMIREVKEKFNLSSDVEALNMLVAIAYKNLKSLID